MNLVRTPVRGTGDGWFNSTSPDQGDEMQHIKSTSRRVYRTDGREIVKALGITLDPTEHVRVEVANSVPVTVTLVVLKEDDGTCSR
jgi:hypothetical protein